MHASVIQFVDQNLYPNEVAGKSILEVGSANVNGSVRPIIEAHGPKSYVGLDIAEAPGVDVVEDVMWYNVAADAVVSCEMLEHAKDWTACLARMCFLTNETLIVTCRGPGFPYHNPPDYWRPRPHDLVRVVVGRGLTVVECIQDPQVPGVFLKAIRPAHGAWKVRPAPPAPTRSARGAKPGSPPS